jgi:hypothetical protein
LLAREQADALFNQGKRLGEQGSYAEAVKCFKRGLKSDPNHVYMTNCLGLLTILASERQRTTQRPHPAS